MRLCPYCGEFCAGAACYNCGAKARRPSRQPGQESGEMDAESWGACLGCLVRLALVVVLYYLIVHGVFHV